MRRRLWDFLGKWLSRRGNANTMFALAGKRHGWQRKGGPVMMRSTSPLSFRKSTVVASIRVQGGQSFLRGFYGNPTLRAMHSIHKCVAKDAPHLFHWRLSSVSVGRTVYSQKQKQRLVSKLPDRCFCFDFAWLVTFNLLVLCNCSYRKVLTTCKNMK